MMVNHWWIIQRDCADMKHYRRLVSGGLVHKYVVHAQLYLHYPLCLKIDLVYSIEGNAI